MSFPKVKLGSVSHRRMCSSNTTTLCNVRVFPVDASFVWNVLWDLSRMETCTAGLSIDFPAPERSFLKILHKGVPTPLWWFIVS